MLASQLKALIILEITMKKSNPVTPRLIKLGEYYYAANPCIFDMYSVIPAEANTKATLVFLAERGLLFRTKAEAVLHAYSLIGLGIELVRQMSQDPTNSDDDGEVDDDNDDTCSMCAGTGEGQYDGQSCSYCKGKGY